MENVIEKSIELRATRSRVWGALTDYKEFGAWFLVNMDAPFAAGSTASGNITHPGYEHLRMEFDVVALEPETFFAYKWHPFAVEPDIDYRQETPTLVEFRLEDVAGGTLLRVRESGFAALPDARQARAFKANDGGWKQQLANIEAYLAKHA